MTDEQKAAFALIDQVLQPSTVSQLAAQGSREAWVRINQAIETLRPAFSIDTTPPADGPPPSATDRLVAPLAGGAA
jgi:hypothetical protein